MTAESHSALEPGTAIGRWTLTARIGGGGFGVVYRACSDDRRPDVAIKVMHADLVHSADAVRRFEREVDVLARLRHPGIAAIVDVGRLADGRPYYAMEHLAGEDLAARLARTGRMSPEQAEPILAALCDALATAHRHGIIHRDLKPSNVFLAYDQVLQGGSLRSLDDRPAPSAPGKFLADARVLLLDFGIAKLVDDAPAAITTSWQVLGTPAYRAPEQVGKRADARTDIYGLGALAFEMLTGRPPFGGDTVTAQAYLHRHARRPRASVWADVSPRVDDLLARAMSIDPADRQTTVPEFRDQLRAALRRPGERTESVPAIAVRVAIRRAPGTAIDGELVDEIDRVLAAARRWLRAEGFSPVVDGTAVVVMARPLTAAARAAAAAIAADLTASVGARIQIDIDIHEAAAVVADGHVLGGPLTQLGGWADETRDWPHAGERARIAV